MNQDVLGALKSALSRKYSLAQARQTLVNAGYSLQEIKEAEGALNSKESLPVTEPLIENSSKISQPKTPLTNSSKEPETKTSSLNVKQNMTLRKKKIIVLMSAIIIILLGGVLAYFLLS